MSEGFYVFDPNRLVTYWAIRRTENETIRILTPDERHLFDLLSNLTNMQTLSPPNVLHVCNFVERRRSPRTFDINGVNEDGMNPLAISISKIKRWWYPFTRIHLERFKRLVVHTMINHGANVFIRIHTKTMLQIACESQCQLDIVQLLIDEGISVNDKDEHNHTPLHCAALWADVPVVSILIENGADVTARNDVNETPITCLMKAFTRNVNSVGGPWHHRIDTILDLFMSNGGNINDISTAASETQSCLFRAVNGIGLDSKEAKVNFIHNLLDL